MKLHFARLRWYSSAWLMHTLCILSLPWLPSSPRPGWHHSRIWGGPLRGMLLALPRLERPSMLLGTYEQHVVQAIERQAHPGMIVYDIGTHVGYMTLLLAKLVGTTGSVFAFEPDPVNQKVLAYNATINGFKQVTTVFAAVSDTNGTADFAHFQNYSLVGHLAQQNTPGDATLVKVPTLTLDAFVFEQNHPAPAFIKLDVEGAEMQVLHGARRLLEEVRPVLIAEIRVSFWPAITAMVQEIHYQTQILQGSEADMKRFGLTEILFLPEEKARGTTISG